MQVDGNQQPAAVAPALEIVDVTRPPDDLEGIVAANAFHHAFALGTFRSGAAAPPWTDPHAAIRDVHDLLAAVGERLWPGDVILCGALTHDPVAPGERARAEIEGLGAVEIQLSPA